MGKIKKLGLFLGTLFLTLGLINIISAQFPTKAPYSAVSRDFRFMQDVQIDGALTVTGAITTTGGLTPGGDIVLTDDEQVLFGTGADASIDYDDDDNALVIGVPIASSEKGLIIADQVDVAADFNFGGLVTTTSQPVLSFVDADTDAWFKVGFFNDDEPFFESSGGDLLINPNYDQNVTFFEGVNANGENPTIKIFGYKTDTAAQYGQWQVDTSGNLIITAESGEIGFGNENLTTTGTLDSGAVTSTAGVTVNSALASGEIGLNLFSITPTYSRFVQSDAEGIASSSDTRLGLDETLRNFIICDRGDIATDFTLAASANPTAYLYDADHDSWLMLGWDTDDVPKLQSGGAAAKIGLYSDLFTDRWLEQDTNTFIGVLSGGAGNLAHSTGDEGYHNTAVGYWSLFSITDGYKNTAVGKSALYNNLGGYHNTALGYSALHGNTTGTNNVAIGFEALHGGTGTGTGNTGLGNSALHNLTSGQYNAGMGDGAMYYLSSGQSNTAMGRSALLGITTGRYNTGVGEGTLYSNDTGYGNTAIGYKALNLFDPANTDGGNIAIGYQAGDNITTGKENIIIGYDLNAASATGDYQIDIGGIYKGVTSGGTAQAVIAGHLDPDGDGTQDLGHQTTAQWANLWADAVNGSDFCMLNGWRILESEKYHGYPKGVAIGNSGFTDGIVTDKMPRDIEPLFVVTEEWIEYQGIRFTSKDLEGLLSLLHQHEHKNGGAVIH